MIRQATTRDIMGLERVDNLGISQPADEWLEAADDVRAIVLEGRVIAVVGLNILWPGVGQVWLESEPRLGIAAGRMLVRSIRSLVPEIMEAYDLHRLQTYVNGLSARNQAFNEAVGFNPESVMFMAAPDKTDIIVYVCLRRQ